jgi:hypothetical protein
MQTTRTVRSGRGLVIGFLAFLAIFAGALVWFQFFAYYERVSGVEKLVVAGEEVAVTDYSGIDAGSSPLKLRGCFRADPAAFAAAEPAPDAAPLNAPFWFGCFDSSALTQDLASGAATGLRLARNDPAGFDVMLALYPDGRGFLWRQLNERYR